MSVRSTRRRSAVAAAGVLAGVLSFALVPAALAGESTDPQGDTRNDDTNQPVDVPQADILRSWISIEGKAIVLGQQVRKPTDPAKDKGWIEGDSSAEWDLDVNDDGKADYTVALSNEDNHVTGGVQKPDAGDDDPDLCSVTRWSYAPEAGYTVTVDSACVGSPGSVAYQAEFFYDTAPNDDNAAEITDASPDQGLTGR